MSKWSDQIPEWSKQGSISLKNYNLRALWHGQTKQWGDNWPMLALGGPLFGLWHEYFSRHLEGFPWAFKALMENRIKQMNVPESRPEWFDPSFVPTPGYRPFLARRADDFEPGHRDWMARRFNDLLADMRGGRLSLDAGERRPAPAGHVFTNYDEALRRNGKPRSA